MSKLRYFTALISMCVVLITLAFVPATVSPTHAQEPLPLPLLPTDSQGTFSISGENQTPQESDSLPIATDALGEFNSRHSEEDFGLVFDDDFDAGFVSTWKTVKGWVLSSDSEGGNAAIPSEENNALKIAGKQKHFRLAFGSTITQGTLIITFGKSSEGQYQLKLTDKQRLRLFKNNDLLAEGFFNFVPLVSEQTTDNRFQIVVINEQIRVLYNGIEIINVVDTDFLPKGKIRISTTKGSQDISIDDVQLALLPVKGKSDAVSSQIQNRSPEPPLMLYFHEDWDNGAACGYDADWNVRPTWSLIPSPGNCILGLNENTQYTPAVTLKTKTNGLNELAVEMVTRVSTGSIQLRILHNDVIGAGDTETYDGYIARLKHTGEVYLYKDRVDSNEVWQIGPVQISNFSTLKWYKLKLSKFFSGSTAIIRVTVTDPTTAATVAFIEWVDPEPINTGQKKVKFEARNENDDVWVDHLWVYVKAPATPTPIPPTKTNTPLPTKTYTPIPPTKTFTPTATRTPTLTPSATASATSTPTGSPTDTPTDTPFETPTITPSVTPTGNITCLSWQEGNTHSWVKSPWTNPEVSLYWDSNGLYATTSAVDGIYDVGLYYQLPAGDAWKVYFITSVNGVFEVAQASETPVEMGGVSTSVPPTSEGSYYITEPFVELRWTITAPVITPSPIFIGFCYAAADGLNQPPLVTAQVAPVATPAQEQLSDKIRVSLVESSVQVFLFGAISDDGQPINVLSHQWEIISGPPSETGEIAGTIVNADLLNTTVTLQEEGVYVLRLNADDLHSPYAESISRADIVITVEQLPDLLINSVDDSALEVDNQTLALSGEFKAEISNPTDSEISTPFTVLFFEDLNFNGVFDVSVDSELGSVTGLEIDSGVIEIVSAAAGGHLKYAASPIYAFVDSTSNVTEINENNNYQSSEYDCRNVNRPIARGGRVIIVADEWPTTTEALVHYNQENSLRYMCNVTNWFTGGAQGNFLVYSSTPLAYNNDFKTAIEVAGHQLSFATPNGTLPDNLPFTLENLLLYYDGVFLAGGVTYPSAASQSILKEYVANGGNLYLALGTGIRPSGGGSSGTNAQKEAEQWQSLANHFGFTIAGVYNGVPTNHATPGPHRNLPVTSKHLIFDRVNTLHFANMQPINLLASVNPYATILQYWNQTQGMFGIYEKPCVQSLPDLVAASVTKCFIREVS